MKNSIPSVFNDPASTDSLVGVLKFVFNKLLQNTDGMLPAKVIAYNRAEEPNFVQVQPLIAILKTDNKTTSRPQIAKVPLFTLGGGGFFINFNLNPGDLGWIKASDRDISLFLQSYEESKPNTLRVKSFSDAVFYPDVMRGYTIAETDLEGMVISNTAGTIKIVLTDLGVNITCPLMTLNGNLLVNGNIGATGTITPGVL